jgi:hypothetical protein
MARKMLSFVLEQVVPRRAGEQVAVLQWRNMAQPGEAAMNAMRQVIKVGVLGSALALWMFSVSAPQAQAQAARPSLRPVSATRQIRQPAFVFVRGNPLQAGRSNVFVPAFNPNQALLNRAAFNQALVNQAMLKQSLINPAVVNPVLSANQALVNQAFTANSAFLNPVLNNNPALARQALRANTLLAKQALRSNTSLIRPAANFVNPHFNPNPLINAGYNGLYTPGVAGNSRIYYNNPYGYYNNNPYQFGGIGALYGGGFFGNNGGIYGSYGFPGNFPGSYGYGPGATPYFPAAIGGYGIGLPAINGSFAGGYVPSGGYGTGLPGTYGGYYPGY